MLRFKTQQKTFYSEWSRKITWIVGKIVYW